MDREWIDGWRCVDGGRCSRSRLGLWDEKLSEKRRAMMRAILLLHLGSSVIAWLNGDGFIRVQERQLCNHQQSLDKHQASIGQHHGHSLFHPPLAKTRSHFAS